MAYDPFPAPDINRWLVAKPTEELMRHSLSDRWEFTRRHPYYVRFRPPAAEPDVDGQPPVSGPMWLARTVLAVIGVRGPYPPPDAPPTALGVSALGAVWAEGAVAPQTPRSLLNMLLLDLSPEEALYAGMLLYERGKLPPEDKEGVYGLLQRLEGADFPGLGQFLNRPLLAVNPHAPNALLTAAFDAYVARLKAGEQIPDIRRRSDKTADYLAVRDLVEGWTEAGYDLAAVVPMKKAAERLGIAASTARRQYASAYAAVVGRDYAQAVWLTLLGFPKVGAALTSAGAKLSPRYRVRGEPAQSVTLVTETTLGPAEAESGSVAKSTADASAAADVETKDLMDDIRQLLTAGYGNAEIIERLELSAPDSEAGLDFLRRNAAFAM